MEAVNNPPLHEVWILEDCVSSPHLGKPQWPCAYSIPQDKLSQDHPPAQDVVVCISDIHGHVDKCRDIWAQLQQRMGVEGLRATTVVFLGDYCDRGNAAAEVSWDTVTVTVGVRSGLGSGLGLVMSSSQGYSYIQDCSCDYYCT